MCCNGNPPRSISLNETSLSLKTGETFQLDATSNPADAAITWTSSAEETVTVNGTGLVTAIEAGNAIITASIGEGISASCSITVTQAAPEAGDYFYSDGTFSSNFNSEKTLVGIIFYAGHHPADHTDYSSTGIGQEKCHGYVTACTDADAETCVWGEVNYRNALGNFLDDRKDDSTDGELDIDFNGYTYTQNMIKAAIANGGLSGTEAKGYPAAYYATEYTPSAPENTSGWFLPSASQLKTIKSIRNTLASKSGFMQYRTEKTDYYWTSSESTYGQMVELFNAITVNMGDNPLTGKGTENQDKTDTNQKHPVRPILAF